MTSRNKEQIGRKQELCPEHDLEGRSAKTEQ